MAELKKGNGKKKVPASVTFHYLKSTQYRVVHVDGAIGGPTPNGFIHISMYNERAAIPREQTFSVNENGTLGGIERETTHGGIVREMEVDAIMNLNVAKNLRDWLTMNIDRIEQPKG